MNLMSDLRLQHSHMARGSILTLSNSITSLIPETTLTPTLRKPHHSDQTRRHTITALSPSQFRDPQHPQPPGLELITAGNYGA